MIRIPTNREPTHPGEMLVKEFLIQMQISQRQLASGIHVPYQRVNELVNKKRGVTPSTALRLAKFFAVSPRLLVESASPLGPLPSRRKRTSRTGQHSGFPPPAKNGLTAARLRATSAVWRL